MTAPKILILVIIFACLVISSLLSHKVIALTPQAVPAGITPGMTGIPPYRPALRLAKTLRAGYDPDGCRTACDRKGFWGPEAQRLVNACKIGCSLGNDYCR